MRTVRYYVATTLDGFIAREDGAFDFFPHDDELVADFFASIREDFDAVVMGRATYEVGLAQGVSDPYPWLDTYVVSRTLAEPPDPKITLLRGLHEVAALRERAGGSIWLCGGGSLASAMHARGLIDELELKVNPILLGTGIPLFRALVGPERASASRTRAYDSGIVVTRYRLG